LLKILNDTQFVKVLFEHNEELASFDAEFQKLQIDKFDFSDQTPTSQSFVLVNKKAALETPLSKIIIQAKGSMQLPFLAFFTDPDSIKNDMIINIINAHPDLIVEVNNGVLNFESISCNSGIYEIDLEAVHDNIILTRVIEIEVSPGSIPTITTMGNLSFCEGDSLFLQSSPAVSYSWNNGSSEQSIYATSTGDYFVDVIDSLGCTQRSDAVHVEVYPNPIIELGHDTLETSSPVSLDAGVGFIEYLWSTGATTRLIKASDSGWYYVTVTDKHDCTAFDSIYVSLITNTTTPYGDRSINIYPNPNNGSFTISSDEWPSGPIEIKIFNTLGEMVAQESGNRDGNKFEKEIVVENLSTGVYIVWVETGKRRFIDRILVCR